MLIQLLPAHIDNTYRGYKAALWILGLILLLRTIMSVNSMFNGYSVASTADGIPLESFTPAGAQTVVSLFALSAYSRVVTTLLGFLVLIRYRAMVPLMFLLLLLDHAGRAIVLEVLPIAHVGAPPASIVTFTMLALIVIGLILSVRRRPKPISAGAVLLFALCASPIRAQQTPAGHQPDEVAAVLETMDRFMTAISTTDLRVQEQMQTADGMSYRAAVDQAGRWTVRARSNAASVAPSMNDGRTYRERYWSPTVLVRGAIAVVWAPYEFWINGATNHCGIDVFTFVKTDGVWRVANSMWTVEPNACAELRPRDSSAIRP